MKRHFDTPYTGVTSHNKNTAGFIFSAEDETKASGKKTPSDPKTKTTKGLKKNVKNWEAFLEEDDDDDDGLSFDTELDLDIDVSVPRSTSGVNIPKRA